MVSLLEPVNQFLVALVSLRGECAYLYEGVRASAYGRCNEDGPVAVHCIGDNLHYLGHVPGVRYRRTAEFQYLHIVMFVSCFC